MTEQQLLLANIIKNPDGDTERLVYADWLSEHGQGELAEFIRLDIELYRFNNTDPKNLFISDWDRGREVKARRNELWNESHKYGWWNGIPGDWRSTIKNKTQISTANSWDYLFSRGFVHTVSISADGFLKHADALIWHEGQTEECPTCEGESVDWQPHTYCPTCGKDDRGRVPRPCPLTAHPIRKVVLMTWPDIMFLYKINGRNSPGNVIAHHKELLERHWPGIEFVLPEQTIEDTENVLSQVQ